MVAINTAVTEDVMWETISVSKHCWKLRASLTCQSPQNPPNINPDVFIQHLNDSLLLLVKTGADLLDSQNNYFCIQ